jgi:drug/metabolite transporter (DMT)-like permease
MVVLLVPRHGLAVLKPRRLLLQLVRSALLLGATLCFVKGVKTVPLATAHVIGFASPLIVVALSALVLREHVRAARWIAVIGGFFGVLIVLRPGTSEALPVAALWLVAAAGFWSVVQIMSRSIASHDKAETTAVYTYVVALAATSLLVPWTIDFTAERSTADWLAIFAVGLFGGIRHYFVIKAYALAPASVIAPFNYAELIGATLVGLIVFGTLPEPWTWLGAAVIIGAGLYLTRSEVRAKA